jgi:hypothetical protein
VLNPGKPAQGPPNSTLKFEVGEEKALAAVAACPPVLRRALGAVATNRNSAQIKILTNPFQPNPITNF